MEEGRRNLAVGAFVLVGLLALGGLIVLFGRGPTWLVRGRTYPIYIHFQEVAGVRSGNLVTLKGITIGRVVEPKLSDPDDPGAGVDVLVAIDQGYKIPKGSSAKATEPMLGQGRPPIEISPPLEYHEMMAPGDTIEDARVIRGVETVIPKEVVNTFKNAARQIGDAAEALTPVLQELQTLIQARTPEQVDGPLAMQGNLSSAAARLDASLKHFNEVLGDPEVKSQLRAGVANFHEMSEQGKRVMANAEKASAEFREFTSDGRKFIAKAEQTVDNLDGRTEDVAQAAVDALDKADLFLDHLNVVGQQIRRGEGSVGRFIMDDKLYESMLITAERLSLMVEEFRALIAEWRKGKIKVAL